MQCKLKWNVLEGYSVIWSGKEAEVKVEDAGKATPQMEVGVGCPCVTGSQRLCSPKSYALVPLAWCYLLKPPIPGGELSTLRPRSHCQEGERDICPLLQFLFFFFFKRFYLFIHRHTQREAETQAEGEAGSM